VIASLIFFGEPTLHPKVADGQRTILMGSKLGLDALMRRLFRAIIDAMPDAADTRSLPPKFTQPQLSLLVKAPPSGPNWAHCPISWASRLQQCLAATSLRYHLFMKTVYNPPVSLEHA
jgi:hypothetical protein